MRRDPSTTPTEEQQRAQRYALMRGRKTEARLKERAIIIWQFFYERRAAADIASMVGVHVKTVRKWCDRFFAAGVPGLEDAPRSGAPFHFTVAQRCEILAVACDRPEHYDHHDQTLWTDDLLTEPVNRTVDGLNISRSSVVRTLAAAALKPHKTQTWLHSPDPHFKEKVHEIVDIYQADWSDDVVVCSIDEKAGMQANERKYDTKMPQIGRSGRIEYEYIRHGPQSLIASFEIQTGEVVAECRDRRTANDLIEFMDGLADHDATGRKILVIWDNLNTHHDGASQRWTEFHARHGNTFEFHYTPLHASWVNQVEIFFSIVTKRALKHASFRSTDELRERVMAFIARWNTQDRHPFHWIFRGYPMQDKEAV